MRNCLRCTIVLRVIYLRYIYILISTGISQFLTIEIITQSASSLIRQPNFHFNRGVKIHFSANENAQKGALYLVRFYPFHEFFITFRGNHEQLKQIQLTFRTCQRKIAACNSRIGKFDFGFLFSEKVFLRRELLNQILNEQFTRFNFITLIFGFLI